MEIGQDAPAIVVQPHPVNDVSIKERFDEAMKSGRVADVEGPSLRDVIAERSKKSLEAVDLLKEVGEINAHITFMQSSLQLSVDSGSGRSVITVMDKDTGDLIRKIPSEEVLAMSARIRHYMESMQQQMMEGRASGMDMGGVLYEGKG